MTDIQLERTLAALSPELRDEVADFAAFLLSRRGRGADPATGDAHPLAGLAGAWRDEPLADGELLPKRSPGRDVDL